MTNVIVVTAYDMTRYPAIEGNALSIGAGNLGSVVRMPNGDVYFTDVWNPGSWDTRLRVARFSQSPLGPTALVANPPPVHH